MQNSTRSPLLWFAGLSLFLSACTTAKKPPEPEIPRPRVFEGATAPGEPAIDVLGLQRSLRLERDADDLGYADRGFNTCEAGYGYPASRDCRRQNFVVIHFQLQCRDSEGTISNADYEVTPVVSDRVKWNLGKAEGLTETDTAGYGQIRYIASSSQKNQKLRLTVNGKYLILTASEVRRVVAPGSWCGR